MSASEVSRQQLIDQVQAAEAEAEREQLLRDAMHAYQDYLRAKKAFDEAAARLTPFRSDLAQVAA